MTETELKAMAAAAIQGARSTPIGTKAPAAIGTPANIHIPFLHFMAYGLMLCIKPVKQESKNIFIKMLKEVGMKVPKSRATNAVYMQ